jgi:23S rRNA (cytidine1920-2'-O)/16S rRNA (cytidine1409-2'-O)-methyltransferase
LVEKGLAPSRNQAQSLISEGHVYLVNEDGAPELVKKPSQKLSESAQLEVRAGASVEKYVSRGGLKMAAALERLGYEVSEQLVLDLGLSTGGFSDCILQKGARHVVGIDVGHGQLSPRLQNEPRLKSLEGLNARYLSNDETKKKILALTDGQLFDFIVMDLSFISLTLVLPEVVTLLKPQGRLLALVKPQFEVGREGLGKNGIVKDPELWQKVQTTIQAAASGCGLQTEDYFESAIVGGDGNKEFFAFFHF